MTVAPTNRLVLASASPRRVALLTQIGLPPHEVVPANVDETPFKFERPRDLARRLARAKATAITDSISSTGTTGTIPSPCHNSYILGADTVVACGRRVLPKARSMTDAASCLGLLSGRRHRVYGGICLITPEGKVIDAVVMTAVHFKVLSDQETSYYLDGGEWEGKAGGYAIQGCAARFVKQINGSYTNVVGLPVYEVVQLLWGNGYPVNTPRPRAAG